MRIYQASLLLDIFLQYHEIFPENKINILRSFGVPNSINEGFFVTHREKVGSIALDSGVFSLNNPNSVIEKNTALKSYENYLLAFGHLVDFYFNWDANFSEDGFEENISYQKRLENAGLRPVPVIHNLHGEEVDYYIDEGYPIVAIGSSHISNTTFDTLGHVVERLYDAGIKVHLFGTSKFEFISSLPVYSCDITTWALAGAHGRVNFWNKNKTGENKTDSVRLQDYMKPGGAATRIPKDLEIYLDETFGFTEEDLFSYGGVYKRMVVNTHYFVELEKRVTGIHQQKGFIATLDNKS